MFDIDVVEFNKWWFSSYPSLNMQPTLDQMTLICHDENYLSISGWKINVKSKIYQEANANNVKKGMILISKILEEKGTNFIDLFFAPL